MSQQMTVKWTAFCGANGRRHSPTTGKELCRSRILKISFRSAARSCRQRDTQAAGRLFVPACAPAAPSHSSIKTMMVCWIPQELASSWRPSLARHQDAQAVLKQFDADGNGQLGTQELTAFFRQQSPAQRRGRSDRSRAAPDGTSGRPARRPDARLGQQHALLLRLARDPQLLGVCPPLHSLRRFLLVSGRAERTQPPLHRRGPVGWPGQQPAS